MAADFDTYFARKHRYEYERGPSESCCRVPHEFPRLALSELSTPVAHHAGCVALCSCSESLKNRLLKYPQAESFILVVNCFKPLYIKCHKLCWTKDCHSKNKCRQFHNSFKTLTVKLFIIISILQSFLPCLTASGVFGPGI